MTKSVMGLVKSSSVALVVVLVGCGATEEEMAGKDRAIAVLNADLRNTRTKLADDETRLGEAQTDTTRMRDQLKQAGLSPDRADGREGAKFQQAIVEYKLRTEQLAMFDMRVKELRAKLDKLGSAGVRVVIRNNRLVIVVPSDLLFDAGRDDLRQQGKDALAQIAAVLQTDRDLGNRSFVAAAHTDNSKSTKGGPFKDNLGLSLARARQVMLFLVAAPPKAGGDPLRGVADVEEHKADPKGRAAAGAGGGSGSGSGGLNPVRWSAAGHGEFDPLAGSVDQQTKEEQARNRRIELVLEPSLDEGLNVANVK